MKRVGLMLATTLVTVLHVPSAGAVEATSPATLESYTKAREVLDAAIEAVGGAERVNGIETLTIVQSGTIHTRNQSPKVTRPYLVKPSEGLNVMDLKRGWLLNENTAEASVGFVFSTRTVFRGEEDKFVLDLRNKTVQRNESLDPANLDFMHRIFTPLLLRKASQQSATLRFLGEGEVDGRRHDVITFAWDNGGAFGLYVDRESRLVSKYELLFPDPLSGDAASEIFFPSYRDQDGLQVPSGYRIRMAGDVVQEVSFTQVKVNEPIDEMLFEVPEGYRGIDPTPTDPPRVRELAKDVYLVEGLLNWGYNFLFVAFDDHLLAIEANGNSGVSAQAIALIKEKVPDRPIRYLVLSHHHGDHTGGTRAFIAEGARIVTTARNRAFFEEMASATPTLAPDALVQHPREPVFELVDDKRVFSDDNHVVEIHNIGPTLHADDMFVVYLPKEKILFQADMIAVPRSGPIPPANDVTLEFAQKVEALGLEVETLVGVHGTAGTMADLREALEKREAQSR